MAPNLSGGKPLFPTCETDCVESSTGFTSADITLFVQLLRQRQNPFLPDDRSNWSHLFEANDTVAINQISLRCAINAVIYTHSSIFVGNAQHVRVAQFSQPRQCIFAIVFVVETVDWQRAGTCILN